MKAEWKVMVVKTERLAPAGYEWLIRNFKIDVVPHFRSSFVSEKGQKKTLVENAHETHIFPGRYAPRGDAFSHIEFALKHEGLNLEILKPVLLSLGGREIAEYVQAKPLSKYARTVWYFYEALSGEELPLHDASHGNYFDVLDPAMYFTGGPTKSRRHRVLDNTLGNPEFCPFVRRTPVISAYVEKELSKRVIEVTAEYPEKVVRRALQYMYTKETRSSFEIEKEVPDAARAERFICLLRSALTNDELSERFLRQIQNLIVDSRFAAQGYRANQNYVGQSVGHRQLVHFISPQPEDVPRIMSGLIQSSKKMSGVTDPVVHAAAVAFGFVYVHPYEDGNGRLHRYLVHHILSKERFTPENMIFPVSATILADENGYAQCLERFSKPLMSILNFRIDERGEVTVEGESADHYRYPDLTHAAEYLYRTIEKTIDKEYVEELDFIVGYDRAKGLIQGIVDMSDREIDRVITLVLNNGGHLSKGKRKLFPLLTDAEISAIERVVRDNLQRVEASSSSGLPGPSR